MMTEAAAAYFLLWDDDLWSRRISLRTGQPVKTHQEVVSRRNSSQASPD